MVALITLNISPIDPDNFTGPTRQLSGPARSGDVILDTPYGEFARWLWVGVTGTISYIKWDGTTQVLPGSAVAGVWHPIHSIGINSSGTTASGLVWGS